MATSTTPVAHPVRQASAGVLLPAFTLWWREIVRFYRQTTRVSGVLASPLMFWLVIGSGFGTSFRSGGGPGQQLYIHSFYPDVPTSIAVFPSIFPMMSVIEDRKEGFLLSVLVAPVPRTAIVLGKVLGGTTLAAVQGMIFLIFAPFAGVHLELTRVLLVALVVFLDKPRVAPAAGLVFTRNSNCSSASIARRRLLATACAKKPVIVEDGVTFAENAIKKARAVARASMMLTLADLIVLVGSPQRTNARLRSGLARLRETALEAAPLGDTAYVDLLADLECIHLELVTDVGLGELDVALGRELERLVALEDGR